MKRSGEGKVRRTRGEMKYKRRDEVDGRKRKKSSQCYDYSKSRQER